MTERFDVVTFRKSQNDKTYAVRLGSATKRTQGDGFNLYLDAMPAPINGQYQLCVVPHRQQSDRPAQQIDDRIPY